MSALNPILEKLRFAPNFGMFLTNEELCLLDQELHELVEKIARMDTIRQAEGPLRELGALQELLAKLSFGYKVCLSEQQRRFVNDYDRWDVPEERARVYQAIRAGCYLINSTPPPEAQEGQPEKGTL